MEMDSGLPKCLAVSESGSFAVECENQEEMNKLTESVEKSMCAD